MQVLIKNVNNAEVLTLIIVKHALNIQLLKDVNHVLMIDTFM